MQRSTPNITFETDDESGSLHVSIATERLYMESVAPDYLNDYSNLFGNTEIMAKFADGKLWAAAKTKTRVDTWITRWHENDPFSSLAVFKNDNDKFIGHVVLGHGDVPGQSELAYVFDKSIWGKGFGKEAVSTVVKEYAPELVQHGYQVDGKPFLSITATSRQDNEASVKILKSTWMSIVKEEVKYEHNRSIFFISTSELCERHNSHIVEDKKATSSKKL